MSDEKIQIAVIDYQLGNLFSIRHALNHVGLSAMITSDHTEILQADAVILPGVGAFGDAMNSLHQLDLVSPLQDIAQSEIPLIGICLGLQLLFTESHEFGRHKGLGIIDGEVVPFKPTRHAGKVYKVPQVCWNRIFGPDEGELTLESRQVTAWNRSLLSGIKNGSFRYFIHSFYGSPEHPSDTLTRTIYGPTSFCSAVKKGSVEAFQFHPERSGPIGLTVYQNLRILLRKKRGEAYDE